MNDAVGFCSNYLEKKYNLDSEEVNVLTSEMLQRIYSVFDQCATSASERFRFEPAAAACDVDVVSRGEFYQYSSTNSVVISQNNGVYVENIGGGGASILEALYDQGFFAGDDESVLDRSFKNFLEIKKHWAQFLSREKRSLLTDTNCDACDQVIALLSGHARRCDYPALTSLVAGESLDAFLDQQRGKFFVETDSEGARQRIFLFGSDTLVVMKAGKNFLNRAMAVAAPTEFLPVSVIGHAITKGFDNVAAVPINLTSAAMSEGAAVEALIGALSERGMVVEDSHVQALKERKDRSGFKGFCERHLGKATITSAGNVIVVGEAKVLIIPQANLSNEILLQVAEGAKPEFRLEEDGKSVELVEEVLGSVADKAVREIVGDVPLSVIIAQLKIPETELRPDDFKSATAGISATEAKEITRAAKLRPKSRGGVKVLFEAPREHCEGAVSIAYSDILEGALGAGDHNKILSELSDSRIAPTMIMLETEDGFLTLVFGSESVVLVPDMPNEFLIKNCGYKPFDTEGELMNIYRFISTAINTAVISEQVGVAVKPEVKVEIAYEPSVVFDLRDLRHFGTHVRRENNVQGELIRLGSDAYYLSRSEPKGIVLVADEKLEVVIGTEFDQAVQFATRSKFDLIEARKFGQTYGACRELITFVSHFSRFEKLKAEREEFVRSGLQSLVAGHGLTLRGEVAFEELKDYLDKSTNRDIFQLYLGLGFLKFSYLDFSEEDSTNLFIISDRGVVHYEGYDPKGKHTKFKTFLDSNLGRAYTNKNLVITSACEDMMNAVVKKHNE